MRLYRKLPSFQNVAAGATALLDVPVGVTYHEIKIQYTDTSDVAKSVATIKTDITGIRLNVNGRTQRKMSSTQLLNINTFKGVAEAAGQLPIFFSEPWRDIPAQVEALAWGTKDVRSFQIEVDVGSGATTPKLEAWAEYSLDSRVMGNITKWKEFTVAPAAAGVFNFNDLDLRDAYSAIHAFSANVTGAEVIYNSQKIFDVASVANLTELYKHYGFTIVSGVFPIMFDRTPYLSDLAVMQEVKQDGNTITRNQICNELGVNLTFSGTGSTKLIVEQYGLRD